MATFWYNKGREGFADGSIPWLSSDIRYALIDVGQYNPASTSSHKFISDVTGVSSTAIIQRTSAAATSKDCTDGILDSADPVFSAVASGKTVGAWLVYANSGSDSSSRLVAFVDNSSGLPFATNGGDVTIQLDNGANKLGKI
jgi:hypothetical protein